VRVAAIDIGTNSVRCEIVEVPIGGSRTTLDDEKAYTRLGRGVASSGRLAEEPMQATIEALRRMLRIADEYQVSHLRAVATAAVRDAENGEEFVERARDELGLEIEVISEEEEARLAFLSASESFDLGESSAVLDIGGGSVEIVRAKSRQIEFSTSMPIGAVVMSETHHLHDPMTDEELQRLTKHVHRTLKNNLDVQAPPVGMLIGSGGTITTVAALIAAERDPGIANLHGYPIRQAEIVGLLAVLVRTTAKQRLAMKGMPENRVDIIEAGTVVLLEAMRALGADEIVLNIRGIREGIIIDTVERERGVSRPFDRISGVWDFARHSRVSVAHAEHVARLSLSLFDALESDLTLPAEGRPLLEAAAILHDVGHSIAYERHHRHSFHLISFAKLPGFNAKEIRLIAAIARYHQGSLPRTRHEAMQGLSKSDRQLVEQMASLLKLADGLDRTKGQRVERIALAVERLNVCVQVFGRTDLDVEIHGAQGRADLFERTFGRRVEVINGPSQAVETPGSQSGTTRRIQSDSGV
jgi:exopolyphosphatase/guanosine-5'-triphosphate,3'-diphosphate pyrophosphatase